MTNRIPITRTLAVLAIAVLVVGCSPVSGDASHAHSAEASPSAASHASEPDGGVILTYYLDQEGQDPNNLLARHTYDSTIRMCKHAGQPVAPLGATEMAKLGFWRVRVWQRPGRKVRQIDTWKPVRGNADPLRELCDYTGVKVHSVRKIWVPPDRIYTLDLTKGTGTYEVTNPYSLKHKLIPMSAVRSVAGSVGDRVAGLVMTGHGQNLGQPCDVWKYVDPNGDGYTKCVWSRGLRWGIGSIVGVGSVILWRKTIGDPTAATTWIKTNAFDVGNLPTGSGKVFEIPKNIPVHEGAPPEEDVQ